jgi:hypothetical protein
MPADTFAGLYEFAEPVEDGGELVTHCIAWGRGYEACLAGRDWPGDNTAEDGVEFFTSLAEAERYAAEAAACHAC